MPTKRNPWIWCVLSVAVVLCVSAKAALVISTKSDATSAFVNRDSISLDSLILTNSSSLASQAQAIMPGFTASAMNDGLAGATGITYYGTLWTSYTLNTTVNTQGYNISELRVYSARDASYLAKVFQDYTITYRLVGEADGTFNHALATHVMLDGTARGVTLASQLNPYQETTLTSDDGGFLATNVAAIKMDFSPHVVASSGDNNIFLDNGSSAGYSANFLEFSVLGVASEINAQVSVIITTKSDSSATTFVGRDKISNTDLINSGQITLASVSAAVGGSAFNAANLSDGTAADTGWSNYQSLRTIYYLNTTANSSGYDISQINVFSGNNNFWAFLFQNYTIYYHVVGEYSGYWHTYVWHPLIENGQLANSTSGISIAAQFGAGEETTLKISGDGILARNVDAIMFDESTPVFNFANYGLYQTTRDSNSASAIYQELDVFGSPSVAISGRDPASWPFKAKDPWNTPIGSGAQYANISNGWSTAIGTFINCYTFSIPIYQAQITDRLINYILWYPPQYGEFTGPIRFPVQATPSGGGDLHMAIIDERKATVVETGATTISLSGGYVDAWAGFQNDLRGPGVYSSIHGVRAYGGSAIAGLIRKGELTNGIKHVLALATAGANLNSNAPNGKHYIWPACSSDYEFPADLWPPGTKPYRDWYGKTSNLYIGTLLAIPPSVDIKQIGIGTSGPTYEIAKALQDYGGYIVDMAGAPLVFYAEPAASDEIATDSYLNAHGGGSGLLLSSILPYLKVVSNNTPSSIGGGGGTRRRAWAPPFPPCLLQPQDQSVSIVVSPTFAWNKEEDVISYEFQLSISPTFSGLVKDIQNITTGFTSVTGLSNNQRYYWRVIATNSDGAKVNSSVWSFTTIK